MHKALQIINKIESQLKSLFQLTLVKHRSAFAEDELPGLRLLKGSDKPVEVGNQFSTWHLTINTDVVLLADVDDANKAVLEHALEIHQKLMSDHTLGLAFVSEITPLGHGEPVIDTSSEITVVEYPIAWRVTYRANTLDPAL